MDTQHAGTAESGTRQEGSTNPEASQAPEDGPGTPQAERGVRVSDRLDTLDAAVSDILDRMDADDEAYRELRERVRGLEAWRAMDDVTGRIEKLEAAANEFTGSALGPAPTRRVVGMRDKDGREWPDIWDSWDIEVGHGHRSDPAAWDDCLPHSAPFTPIYEDASEPVAEPNANHVSTSAELVSEPEGVEAEGLEVVDAIQAAEDVVDALCKPRGTPGSRAWLMSIPADPDYDPDLVISRALTMARKEIADATALHAQKDAEIERLERDVKGWKRLAHSRWVGLERLRARADEMLEEIKRLSMEVEDTRKALKATDEVTGEIIERQSARIRELEAREVTEEMVREADLEVMRDRIPHQTSPALYHRLLAEHLNAALRKEQNDG